MGDARSRRRHAPYAPLLPAALVALSWTELRRPVETMTPDRSVPELTAAAPARSEVPFERPHIALEPDRVAVSERPAGEPVLAAAANEALVLASAPDLEAEGSNAAPLEPLPTEGLETAPQVTEDAQPISVQERFFGDQSRQWVALTFDDGPSRENTPRVLEVLRRYEVQATFFVLGHRAQDMPELVGRVHDEGHEIGNHGFSHTSMRSLWKSQITDELATTSRAVEAVIGQQPALVRPPFGRYAPSALPLFAELQLNVVLWSVDSHDWEIDDPEELARSVVRNATPGAIVLLHDRESVTPAALPAIIEGLRGRGFELVRASELTGLPAYVEPTRVDP